MWQTCAPLGRVRVALLAAFVAALVSVLAVPAATGTGIAVTSVEAALIDEVNRVRAVHGRAPLTLDPALQRAARAHSASMLRSGSFGHGALAARLRRFGARGPRLGENIAWGTGSTASAQSIVRMWLRSPGHRANLLRRGWRRIGVGAPAGTFRGMSAVRMVTADFAGS